MLAFRYLVMLVQVI